METKVRDTKSEILDYAQELLQSRGFGGFSYKDLAEKLGIRRASIHHHFPTKEDLGVALCERYTAMHNEAFGQLAEISDPYKRLESLFQLGLQFAEEGKICPIGALETEFNLLPEAIQANVEALASHHRTTVADILEEGRASGAIQFSGSAQDQATLVMSAVQGALQNVRAFGLGYYKTVAKQLLTSMKP